MPETFAAGYEVVSGWFGGAAAADAGASAYGISAGAGAAGELGAGVAGAGVGGGVSAGLAGAAAGYGISAGAGAAGELGAGVAGAGIDGGISGLAAGSAAGSAGNFIGSGGFGGTVGQGGGINIGGAASKLGPVSTGISAFSALNSYEQGQQLKKLAAGANPNPWSAQQGQYQQQLRALMSNPGSVTSLPGYQFQMQQGQQALDRGLAAGGYGGSGNQATADIQYGQNYASNFYNQQLSNLAGLSGVNSSGNSAAQLAALQAGNTNTTSALNSLAYGAQRYNM